jgi:hypothetical protein
MHDRALILAYADQHGDAAASGRFQVPRGTIWSWRSRAKSGCPGRDRPAVCG